MLVERNRSFVKQKVARATWLRRPRYRASRGLILSDDMDTHVVGRRVVQPAFRSERIASYGALVVEEAVRARSRWRDGATVDVEREMALLALNAIGRALFSAELEDEAAEINSEIQALLDPFPIATARALDLLESIHLRRGLRFVRAYSRLQERMGELVARAGAGGRADDIPALLTKAARAREGISDEQLPFEALGIFLAGAETTAASLTWTWYLLGRDPHAERRLHEELDSALAGRLPDSDDIASLPFARMVVAESLRLYPPSWFIGRRAIADVEVMGRSIPAGSIVLLSAYVVQRDPRWFPDPERFDPDRWAEGAQATRPRFAYFPFGGGPRQCIGERLAWLEGVLVLAAIGQEWRLRPVGTWGAEPSAVASLRPRGGLPMAAERRRADG